MRADAYGEHYADVYDEIYKRMFQPEMVDPVVEVLAELAGLGRALELAVGTGRIALPLAQRGVRVTGLDSSPAMLARLRAKPNSERIETIVGDMADVGAPGTFELIFVVFSTFFALFTQEAQRRCFENVARHLTPSGTFVIEAYVPDMSFYDHGQSIKTIDVGTDSVFLNAQRIDPTTQQVLDQHILLKSNTVRLLPLRLRYAWPAELDLMAALAGMRLRYRWGDWRRRAFSVASGYHISVYERAP